MYNVVGRDNVLTPEYQHDLMIYTMFMHWVGLVLL